MKKTVVVGMSGGVDSSAAAHLLSAEYNVIGVTLRMHDCCDAADAADVCRTLGIPHHVIDVTEVFRKYVIDDFISEYLAARTPNPCVRCNFHLKFGAMLDIADTLGADFIATGHYARLVRDDETGELFPARAVFSEKDQTYALYRLTQQKLSRALFPLGGLPKSEVRRIAAEIGLNVAEKRDSQEICFIPDGDYAGYISRRAGAPAKGRFIGPDGECLGMHRGLLHYTVGQRRGLGIAYSERLYVTALDPMKNEVHLGVEGSQNTREVTAGSVSFISNISPEKEFACTAKIRYNGIAAPAEILWDGNRLHASFSSPQRAAAPGQSLVLYDGDRVLGGGIIE